MEGLVDPAAEVRQMGPRVVARVREPHAGHRTVEVRRHGLHGALVLHILHRILCFHGLPQHLAQVPHPVLTDHSLKASNEDQRLVGFQRLGGKGHRCRAGAQQLDRTNIKMLRPLFGGYHSAR